MGLTQLNFDGLNKIEVALSLIKYYEPEEGYYLAFSGGKDSIVIYDLTVKSGKKFDARYCVSPIDPPEVHKFIREYYPDVIWDYHARGFWKLVHKKGLPMRKSRWCCEYIKEAGGKNRVVIVGNRRHESTTRKHQKCFEKSNRGGKFFLRPIIDWTTDEVWEYIKANQLPYCSLYDKGFKRLGCVLCPFVRDVKREIEYFPKIARLWRRACDHIIERRLVSGKEYKHNFKTGEELWQWWISRK